MHNISSITIQNFKSIKEGLFELSNFTPLVGYNNAGKTNILQALSWIIKKYSIQSEDFFDQTKPIIVTVEISGISDGVLNALEENHRGRVAPLVVDGRITMRRVQNEPNRNILPRIWILNGRKRTWPGRNGWHR